MKKILILTLALIATSDVLAQSQTPLNRAFLQSNMNGNSFAITNLSSVIVRNNTLGNSNTVILPGSIAITNGSAYVHAYNGGITNSAGITMASATAQFLASEGTSANPGIARRGDADDGIVIGETTVFYRDGNYAAGISVSGGAGSVSLPTSASGSPSTFSAIASSGTVLQVGSASINTAIAAMQPLNAVSTITATNGFIAGAGSITNAPLTFRAGTNLTTPVAGAMEYNGRSLHWTPNTLQRRTIAMIAGVRTNRTTIPPSSTTPVIVQSTTPPANTIISGSQIESTAIGQITQRNDAASQYIIEVRLGGVLILSMSTPFSTALVNAPFTANITTTIRTEGVTGTCIASGTFTVGGISLVITQGAETVINTTASNTYEVIMFATENNAATGPVFIEQGRSFIVDNP